MTAGERLYERLVGLYPLAFRRRYQAEMVQLFGDQLRDARARRQPFAVTLTWFRSLGDLVMSAASEHTRGGRDVGHSLGEPPSGRTRLLGLAGVLGGLAILAGFVVQTLIFETLPWLVTVRIILFNVGAIAIVLGLRTTAVGWSRAAVAISWLAAASNAWYAAMTMLPVIGWAPFAGDHYVTLFLAGVSMWVGDAALGLVLARRGGLLGIAGVTLAIGSVLALLGMDRLGLTRGDLSSVFVPLAVAGQGIGGIAWVVLGIAVVTRRRPSAAGGEARAPKA